MIEAKDQFGNEIKAGDIITYPGRQGSSLWMNVARVKEVTKAERYWSNDLHPCLKIERVGTRWNWDKTIGQRYMYYPHNTSLTVLKNVTVISKEMLANSENKDHQRFVEMFL